MINRVSKHDYFMMIAKVVSARSTCLSRKNGAVLVVDGRIISTGYNGSMPGAPHCSDFGKCFHRELNKKSKGKYDFCRSVHAEANVIANAAMFPTMNMMNSAVFCTLQPCYICLKLMSSAGVRHVYFEKYYDSNNSERDKFWHDQVFKESPMTTFQQYTISKDSMKIFMDVITGDSSRKLKKKL